MGQTLDLGHETEMWFGQVSRSPVNFAGLSEDNSAGYAEREKRK